MKIFSTGWSRDFDGPGKRWVIYLKGCNLRCKWCANPESISSETEMLFYPKRSVNCHKACKYGAIEFNDSQYKLNRQLCSVCVDRPCVNQWHSSAFEVAGCEIEAEEILEQAIRLKSFFGKNGGITFGGGEPTLQFDELIKAAHLLKKADIHCAVETNACNGDFGQVADAFDLVIADVKCISGELAEKWLGASVDNVIDNILAVAYRGKEIIVRVPLVCGFNDSETEIRLIAEALARVAKVGKGLKAEVIRMHQLGVPKYEALGKICKTEKLPSPSIEKAKVFVEHLQDKGIKASLANQSF